MASSSKQLLHSYQKAICSHAEIKSECSIIMKCLSAHGDTGVEGGIQQQRKREREKQIQREGK